VKDATSVTGNSLEVARWVLLSRLTGFLRVGAIAAVLGPTFFGNLFQTANLVPNLTFELLTGSLVASLVVPPLVRHIDRRDPAAVGRVAGGFLGLAMVASLVAGAGIVLGGPLLMRLLTAGVADRAVAADQQRVGWLLLVLVVPQILLYSLATVGVAVQHAHSRFALAAAAPAVENLVVVAAVVVAGASYGRAPDVADVATGQVLVLGLGSTVAVGLHAALQWFGAHRAGVALVPRAGWRDPEVRIIARLAVPSMGYTGLNAARLFGVLVVAGAVPGGVVAFQLAINFFNLPVALGAKPVATALLPRLARAHHEHDRTGFTVEFMRGVGMALFVTAPVAVAYVVLARPLARAVTFGEMATDVGIALVAASIASVALGMIGDGSFVVGTTASYAKADAKAPLRAMVLRTLLAAVGMAIAVVATDGIAVLVGLGLAIAVADILGATYLVLHVRSQLGSEGPSARAALQRAVLSSAVMVVPTAGLGALLGYDDRLGAVLAVVTAGSVGLAAYLCAQHLLGSPELGALRDVVKPRRETERDGGSTAPRMVVSLDDIDDPPAPAYDDG
jgi:putative peptidoglycan lipid II flippase